MLRATILSILTGLLASTSVHAQLTTPPRISATTGDSRGHAENGLDFRRGTRQVQLNSLISPGDVDGDGVNDLAMSVANAAWILFMNADGTVRTYQKNPVAEAIRYSIAPIGDFDGDGVPDLITGVHLGNEGNTQIIYLNRDGTINRQETVCERSQEPRPDEVRWGACYVAVGDNRIDLDGDGYSEYLSFPQGLTITFLDDEGQVKRFQHICNHDAGGDFPACRDGNLTEEYPEAGFAVDGVSSLGDLDGDGVPDLAVGGGRHDDGCGTPNCPNGVVWILFMNPNGTVKNHQKIGRTDGNFSGELRDSTWFGVEVAALQDLDGDDVPELAVGAPGDSQQRKYGEVWILFMNRNGTVKDQQIITQSKGGFTGTLHENDFFGRKITPLGDIDDDPETVETLVVSADIVHEDIDAPRVGSSGALWFLFLREDGTVKRSHMMRSTDFLFLPNPGDRLGGVLASLGDVDGDGIDDLAAGTPENDDDGDDVGSVWILFLNENGTIKRHQRISATWGGFNGTLDVGDRFGAALVRLGEPDAEGVNLAVGAPGDDDGGIDRGAVWLLHLNPNGNVSGHSKLSNVSVNGGLADGERFGTALASPGDLDGDGRPELVVGAPFGDASRPGRGSVSVLFLNDDGSIRRGSKIPSETGSVQFGRSLAGLGAYGNGTGLAVGAGNDSTVWILELDAAGTQLGSQAIQGTDVGVDEFARSLAGLADIDGDGFSELAVGTRTGEMEGMTLLYLDADAGIKSAQTLGSFSSSNQSEFADGLADMGDFDGDAIPDIAIGAPRTFGSGSERGAIWLTSLRDLLVVDIDTPSAEPEVPTPGRQVVVSARIIDRSGRGLINVEVNYRRAGYLSFERTDLTPQDGDRYTAALPPYLPGSEGVEYFVTATNGIGLTSRSPTSGVFSVPVYMPDGLRHPVHAGDAGSAYRIISVPLDLDDRDAGAVLEDDLGSYSRKSWRFFNEDHLELGEFQLNMEPGGGYWLLVKEPGQEITTGPGTSVLTDLPFRIPLRRGWSLIGNPFTFQIPIENVSTTSEQDVEFLSYEGSWSPLDSLLAPFAGYALFSSGPDTLLIDPEMSPTSGSTITRQDDRERAMEWAIRILAQHGEARDAYTVAGVASTASRNWDELDRLEPPVVGEYVRVSFPHIETSEPDYAVDVRPIPEAQERWTFEVATHRYGRVELQFDGIDSVPSAFDVSLVDGISGVQQDLRSIPRYDVVTAGEGKARELKLVVERSMKSRDVPSQFELFQNFPNPFQGATTIRYGVPATSVVTIDIFSVLGQRISSLVDREMTAGYHTAVWDGRNDAGVETPSGLYLVRMRASGALQTLTMMRVR